MKKLMVLLLAISFQCYSGNEGGSGEPETNVAATEYIIIFSGVDPSLRAIGDSVPDFVVMNGIGSANASNEPLFIIDGVQ